MAMNTGLNGQPKFWNYQNCHWHGPPQPLLSFAANSQYGPSAPVPQWNGYLPPIQSTIPPYHFQPYPTSPLLSPFLSQPTQGSASPTIYPSPTSYTPSNWPP